MDATLRARKREEILRQMREKVRGMFSRDMLVVRSESTVKDIERAANLLYERIEEWYIVYFPELKLPDRVKYCKLILAIDKERMGESKKAIMDLLGDKGNEVADKLASSSGADLMEKDLATLMMVANQILSLEELKEEVERYTEIVVREVAPNLSEVGGPRIASKLIAHVGGIQRLARLPASTIQVLGAEKALFKHLRKGTKPPKHGIIFQHTSVHSSPKEYRGKLARAIASKLSIAAKMDAYGKRFIGKEMKAALDAKIADILSRKPKPKPKPVQQGQQSQGQSSQGGQGNQGGQSNRGQGGQQRPAQQGQGGHHGHGGRPEHSRPWNQGR
jgi:nucleolar protein 56